MDGIDGKAETHCSTLRLLATSAVPKTRTSRIRCVGLIAAGIIAVAAFALFAWHGGNSEWAVKDLFEPPPSPTPTSDASPRLDSVKPLASTRRSIKPVVAADHHGQVVVIAQDYDLPQGPYDPPRDMSIIQWSSRDGGVSWEAPFKIPLLSKEEIFADPWLATDRRGRFYSIVICCDESKPIPEVLNAFYRSCDRGHTWSPRILVTPSGDRPVLAVSANGKLLVAASMAGEKRQGASTEMLHPNDPNYKDKLKARFRHFSAILVSDDRGSHWKLLPGPLGDTHAICFSVVVEDDGRIAGGWVASTSDLGGKGVGGGSRSVVCSTLDHGQTWTETVLVSGLQPDRPHPFNGERFPVLAVDGNRNVYAAFVSALGRGLFVRTSKDWVNWDSPTQLSSDQAAEVRMPAIAAWGPMVHVSWMERRDASWQMYYRGSKDHGRSWSERLLVSVPNASSTLIDNKGFQITGDDDQTSVADDGLGNAHIVWCVSPRNGNTSGTAWHAIVRWRRHPD